LPSSHLSVLCSVSQEEDREGGRLDVLGNVDDLCQPRHAQRDVLGRHTRKVEGVQGHLCGRLADRLGCHCTNHLARECCGLHGKTDVAWSWRHTRSQHTLPTCSPEIIPAPHRDGSAACNSISHTSTAAEASLQSVPGAMTGCWSISSLCSTRLPHAQVILLSHTTP